MYSVLTAKGLFKSANNYELYGVKYLSRFPYLSTFVDFNLDEITIMGKGGHRSRLFMLPASQHGQRVSSSPDEDQQPPDNESGEEESEDEDDLDSLSGVVVGALISRHWACTQQVFLIAKLDAFQSNFFNFNAARVTALLVLEIKLFGQVKFHYLVVASCWKVPRSQRPSKEQKDDACCAYMIGQLCGRPEVLSSNFSTTIQVSKNAKTQVGG